MTVMTQTVITDEELLLVEDALRLAVTSNVPLLAVASEHIVLAGGKRIRPRLVLLACKASGAKDVSPAVPFAAAVELLHTASLIHDDINDHSDTRRGRASVNALVGNNLALLVGDFVFIQLLSLMADFNAEASLLLAGACRGVIEGETLQALNAGNTETQEAAYIGMVSQKTASLFSACAALGALAAGADSTIVDALGAYGLNLGIAFQIRDDTLDLFGDSSSLGKPVANDLADGKLSLAAIHGLQRSAEARDALKRGDLIETTRLLQSIGALDYALQRATDHAEMAKRSLESLPSSAAKCALNALADFVVSRDR